jgi:hypothetical protein
MRIRRNPSLPHRAIALNSAISLPIVEQLLRLITPHPLLHQLQVRRVRLRIKHRHLGALHDPSSLCPSISFGQVHPFGVRRMIIGHRGRSGAALFGALRAFFWIARISFTQSSITRAIS